MGYNFYINGSHYCRVLNFEQNKPNSMSLDQKLREELGMGGSSIFGGFLGVGARGGGGGGGGAGNLKKNCK